MLIFKLVEGDFPSQSCHLEIHVDDNAFPAYSTKIKSKHQKFGDSKQTHRIIEMMTLLIEGVQLGRP